MIKLIQKFIDEVDFCLTCSRLAEMGEYGRIRELMTENRETA